MKEKQSRGEVRASRMQQVAAQLFLKRGYDGVTIDEIVALAGGSKSTVYAEFGGKCGLFIRSIEKLCLQANEALEHLDYTGLDLHLSLEKLAFQTLKLITSKRSVDLHRLVIGEAAQCPEVGEAWYRHGPRRTTAIIHAVLLQHSHELREDCVDPSRLATLLHDALLGDSLDRLLAGVDKAANEADLVRLAHTAVQVVLAGQCKEGQRKAAGTGAWLAAARDVHAMPSAANGRVRVRPKAS